MLIHLIRLHLLGMVAWRSGAGSLGHATRRSGSGPLPQALLREVDGLGLRHRAVGVRRLAGRLVLRLLLAEVHSLLGRHRHARLQLAC